MRAVFVAHGPSFKSGVVLPVFDNVDVYPLLAKITGVKGEGRWLAEGGGHGAALAGAGHVQ
jgi:hypothetical protein